MIKALLFDLDGVIIDSLAPHINAFIRVFKEIGISVSPDYVRSNFGQGATTLFEIAFKERGLALDSEKYSELKDIYFREIIKEGVIEIPGSIDFIKKAKKDFKIAVCSATHKKNLKLIAKHLNFDNITDVCLGRQDVINNKPAPDIYLKAAKILGVKPNDCIVFEDSPPGISAGKSAGMKVIALTTNYTKKLLEEADFIIGGYDEIDIEELKEGKIC
ncbi:MAG: HAD family phosphatase [archaeon]